MGEADQNDVGGKWDRIIKDRIIKDRMMKDRMMFGRERLIRMMLGVSGAE